MQVEPEARRIQLLDRFYLSYNCVVLSHLVYFPTHRLVRCCSYVFCVRTANNLKLNRDLTRVEMACYFEHRFTTLAAC